MHALHELVLSGKVRYLGASSMWAYQFAMMQAYADKHGLTKFVAMQVSMYILPKMWLRFADSAISYDKNRYNLLYREEEREMNKYCKATGVAITPVSQYHT